MEANFTDIKKNLESLTEDLKTKLASAEKLGQVLQDIKKDAKPLEEKSCTINGWHCVIQRFESKTTILFATSLQAQEFYKEKNVNLFTKFIRLFK